MFSAKYASAALTMDEEALKYGLPCDPWKRWAA
jgi:hypothetical protein